MAWEPLDTDGWAVIDCESETLRYIAILPTKRAAEAVIDAARAIPRESDDYEPTCEWWNALEVRDGHIWNSFDPVPDGPPSAPGGAP